MDRGIRLASWEWPDRSKWWLFSNGMTMNQTDGTLVVLELMEEVARDLVTTVDEAKQGIFQPQRGNDELTRALKNPEHLGRARGIGVVPWKVPWAGDSSYKTHRKSKAEQDEKFRAIQEEMNKRVASLESQMDARVNEAVQQALSRANPEPQAPDVVVTQPLSDAAAVLPRQCPMYQLNTPRLRHHRWRYSQWMISPFQQHASYICELRIYPFT